jgi:hypothetical protein
LEIPMRKKLSIRRATAFIIACMLIATLCKALAPVIGNNLDMCLSTIAGAFAMLLIDNRS